MGPIISKEAVLEDLRHIVAAETVLLALCNDRGISMPEYLAEAYAKEKNHSAAVARIFGEASDAEVITAVVAGVIAGEKTQ